MAERRPHPPAVAGPDGGGLMSWEATYERLVALAANKPTEDDVEFNAWMWRSLYEYGSGNIPDPSAFAEITELAARSPEGYGSVDFAFVARLADGTWATCVGWADTTGFGCREQVDWDIQPTREAAIAFGLDQESRNWLGFERPDGGAR